MLTVGRVYDVFMHVLTDADYWLNADQGVSARFRVQSSRARSARVLSGSLSLEVPENVIQKRTGNRSLDALRADA